MDVSRDGCVCAFRNLVIQPKVIVETMGDAGHGNRMYDAAAFLLSGHDDTPIVELREAAVLCFARLVFASHGSQDVEGSLNAP